MVSYVALLRGINVGGKNMLPMKDLVAMFGDAGCTGARYYIQSGNVVFRAAPALAKRLPDVIAKAIDRRFGYQVPVVIRAAEELADILESNPFPRAETDFLHVAFLASAPKKNAVDALDAKRSPPDSFIVRGREIYLHCPNGFGKTKLTNAYFDSKLGTTSTVRNWRTVATLLQLSS